jgi:hypothetical protein
MEKAYTKAPKSVMDILNCAMNDWHPDLEKAKVRIAVVMVKPELDDKGEPKAPAITHAGHTAAAKVRLAKPGERLCGMYDAMVEIDEFLWDSLDDESQVALLDHELEHLGIQYDADGFLRRNDDGSPKLKLKKDDWCLTGFEAVARRHKNAALEVKAIRDVVKNCQMQFEFPSPLSMAVSA